MASATSKPSPTDLLIGAAQAAIRESASECARADGERGSLILNVEMCFGDRGEPLWAKSYVYFERKRHHKDAAREQSSE